MKCKTNRREQSDYRPVRLNCGCFNLE